MLVGAVEMMPEELEATVLEHRDAHHRTAGESARLRPYIQADGHRLARARLR